MDAMAAATSRNEMDISKTSKNAPMGASNATKKHNGAKEKATVEPPRPMNAWNCFFHSKAADPLALVVGGCIRIAFGVIFLIDKALLTRDLDWFFDPEHGVIPPDESEGGFSILTLAPESKTLLWGLHYFGILQGILLLLGIAPRLQAIGIFVNLVSFLNQSGENFIYSGQDTIMRTIAWMLCFLPMHRLGIYELLDRRKNKNKSIDENTCSSHSMWPFRLLQIQLCLVFLGAGFAKASDPLWQDGSAMYYIIHHHDNLFGLSPFAPPLIYNRVLPLQIMTWTSLVMECSCFVLVWFDKTRVPTVIAMIVFHLGIDLAMNLHVFQWLMMVLWLSFLAVPLTNETIPTMTTMTRTSTAKRGLINLFLVAFLVVFSIETSPLDYMIDLFPEYMHMYFEPANKWRKVLRRRIHPILTKMGVHQQVWDLYYNPFEYNTLVFGTIWYSNDTFVEWKQPDWHDMGAWQRKQFVRKGIYWDRLAESENAPFLNAACRNLAREHGPHVTQIELQVAWEKPPEFHSLKLGPWDEAKQEMIHKKNTTLYRWSANEEVDDWDSEDEDESDSEDEDESDSEDEDGNEL